MRLRQCPRCTGFVTSNRCPHCGATLWPRLWKLAALLGSSAAAMTLMACYGSPCARGDEECFPPQEDLSAVPADMTRPAADIAISDGGATD
jgi:hypothetical protein